MAAKATIKVVAGVLEHEGLVLVQERPAGKDREFLWEFPGGKVKQGEKLEDSLEREFVEELAISVRIGSELWSVVHAYEDVVVDLTLFSVEPLSSLDDLKAREGQVVAWVRKDELTALNFCPADKEFISVFAKT